MATQQKMPFNYLNKRKRMTQSFDKENIHFIRAGQKINVYELIQNSGEDTNIYQIMDKYGVNSQEAIAKMSMNTGQMYQDMLASNAPTDLRDALNKIEIAERNWRQLPLSVRAEFNNSKAEFMNRGEKWLKAKIDEEKAKNQPVNNENSSATVVTPTEESK